MASCSESSWRWICGESRKSAILHSVSFRHANIRKEAQESASLLRIKDSFKKIIIVKDDIKPKRNEDGILTIGLKDFLLDKTV